jgi:hypothetical protein
MDVRLLYQVGLRLCTGPHICMPVEGQRAVRAWRGQHSLGPERNKQADGDREGQRVEHIVAPLVRSKCSIESLGVFDNTVKRPNLGNPHR